MTLLSVKNEVMALYIIEDKVKMINDRISPIKDEYIEEAHSPKKKFTISFDLSMLTKLAATAVCILLAVTILPNYFSKASSGGNGSYEYSASASAPNAVYDEEAYSNNAKTEEYVSRVVIDNGSLSFTRNHSEVNCKTILNLCLSGVVKASINYNNTSIQNSVVVNRCDVILLAVYLSPQSQV